MVPPVGFPADPRVPETLQRDPEVRTIFTRYFFFFCTFFTLAPSQAWSGTFRGYVTCDTTLTKYRNR